MSNGTLLFYFFSLFLWILADKEEDIAGEGSENGDNYEDEAEKREYVKKEYFAKPYKSDGVTEASVNSLIIKNSR
jgi:hypothetical protein